MAKTYTARVEPFWNINLNKGGKKHPFYYQMFYSQCYTRIKSIYFTDDVTKTEFNKLKGSQKAKREIKFIRKILEIESKGFTEKITSFSGYKKKFRTYFSKVDDNYKYSISRIINRDLIDKIPIMNSKERELYSELKELLPLDDYINIFGKYANRVLENPRAFGSMILGFFEVYNISKEEDKVLSYLMDEIKINNRISVLLNEFIESKYLPRKEMFLIDWLCFGLKLKFTDFLDELFKDDNKPVQYEDIMEFGFTREVKIGKIKEITSIVIRKIEAGMLNYDPYYNDIVVTESSLFQNDDS